jgi:dihydroorotase
MRCGMVLCLHGEMPGHTSLVREVSFLPWVSHLISLYPKLKVVLEHITDRRSVEFVRKHRSDYLAATITVHHLYYTLEDIIGDKLNPHAFAKPVPKDPEGGHLEALIDAATSGESCFLHGTDTAPHLQQNKECGAGCAGVYTAPVSTELLVDLFDRRGCLDKLEPFMTTFAEIFYGLTPVVGSIEIVNEEWRVPNSMDGVVPMFAGQKIRWRVV